MQETLRAVIGQLEVWWFGAFHMRWQGLTDDEYFWKPVPDAFCLRREADGLYYDWPPGSRGEATPPVTTIAWRMAHIAQGCFLSRFHTHFGDGPVDPYTDPFPTTAADALSYLDAWKGRWIGALREAGETKLAEPLGDTEHNVAVMQLGVDDPFINLVLHINREVMHHGAEISLLRDLYRARTVT